MTISRESAIVDYLVTFFVDNHITTRMLSEIVSNREDSTYVKSLGLPIDFVLPFFLEENHGIAAFKISVADTDKYDSILMGESFTERFIQDGDYVLFKNHNDDSRVRVLFIASNNLKLGYNKYALMPNSKIFIGRGQENSIRYSFGEVFPEEHSLVIMTDANGNAFIENLGNTIGLYVNGVQVNSAQLCPFDEIFFMGLSIVYLDSMLAVRNFKMSSNLNEVDIISTKKLIEISQKKNWFTRTPRILKSLDEDIIQIDAPPPPQQQDELPLLLTLGPSVTMATVMMASLSYTMSSAFQGGNTGRLVTSAFMGGGMLLGALVWPTLIRKYHRKKLNEKEQYRKKRYCEYVAEIEDKLIAKTKRSVQLMNEILNPAPQDLCKSFTDEVSKLRLWERSIGEEDFLNVRLGLGSRPFSVNIKIPQQNFTLQEDELASLPSKLLERYGTLENVPLALNLFTNRAVGIIGDQSNMNNIINEIILNIVSLHSYDEVKLVFITNPKQKVFFERFKNVPHAWSNDKTIRYFATTIDEVHHVFNSIEEIVQERNDDDRKKIKVPHFIFIVTEHDLIEKEPLSRHLQNPYNNVGITTIFAYGDITILPKACTTIIQSDAGQSGYYVKNQNQNRFIPFIPDTVDVLQLDDFTDNLTNMLVKRDARQMGIAERISFLQMYKAGSVNDLCIEQRWNNNNSAKTLAAPIGVIAGGQPFSLDLHEAYHGCHGLVAGTTGSGKSEFLQAFVLSLAVNYSPKEVAFVLIDFKGGDMAKPFVAKKDIPALPHLAATISNLSGNILHRALVSLKAEIESRQKVFNEAKDQLGIDKLDINSYHKYFKAGKLNQPLPHLVIIIDEFAQLKSKMPEFMEGLIDVAQVGRSLGIHLILATQKPNGVVDPQILSNSRFKVCLKVAEKHDSIDMIGRPDSAMIKNPGRLNLLVGYNEIYETIQSAFSGAEYIPLSKFIPDEEISVQLTDNSANPIHSAKLNLASGKTGKTQLEAIVSDIIKLGQRKNLKVKPLWLDMLPEKLDFSSLKLEKKGLATATLGIVDYVREQEQKSLTIDLAKIGHIGLYGASGTGKTTFMQTLIYSMVKGYGYTPEELNIYAMDFGGRNLGYLKHLPHTVSVAFANEGQKISNIISTLQEIIDERKHAFATKNCSTFAEYRNLGNALPAVVVLIDNYSSFRDKYTNDSERIIDVIASGKTYGIFFIMTSSTRNGIHYRVIDYISSFYTLRLNDNSNYLDILGVRSPIIPDNISGRGLTVVNKVPVEFQVALACSGNNDAERIGNIVKEYQTLRQTWTGPMPISIEENVEGETNLKDTNKLYASSNSSAIKQPIPLEGKENTLVLAASKSGMLRYGIKLEETFKTAIISNTTRDLQKYYGKILASISTQPNRRIVVLDDEQKNFEEITKAFNNCQYISSIQKIDEFITSIKPELNERLDGTDKCKERIFIIIPSFNSFFDMITDKQADFLRQMVKLINHPKYGVQFFTGYNVGSPKLLDISFYALVINAKCNIICPGACEKALEKLEKLPVIHNPKNNSAYFILYDAFAEIRW